MLGCGCAAPILEGMPGAPCGSSEDCLAPGLLCDLVIADNPLLPRSAIDELRGRVDLGGEERAPDP